MLLSCSAGGAIARGSGGAQVRKMREDIFFAAARRVFCWSADAEQAWMYYYDCRAQYCKIGTRQGRPPSLTHTTRGT